MSANFEARSDNTCEGVMAWPVVFAAEKKTYDDGSSVDEWRADLIIEDTPANKDAIDNLCAMASEAAVNMFGADRSKWPPNMNPAVRETRHKANNPQTGLPWEGYEHGKLFISCASIYKPSVIDITGRTIIDPSEIYGGCKAIYHVKARAYNNKSKGVKFTLLAVLKTADGKPFGGDRIDPGQVFKQLIKPGAAAANGQVAPPAAAQPRSGRQL